MNKILVVFVSVAWGVNLWAETGLRPEEIIKRFAAKETEFNEVWQQYTYHQKIVFQILNRVGRVKEQREMLVEVYFSSDGRRETRILEDRGELRSVGVTSEDLEDALHRQPFVLTSDELDKYKIKYRGKENIDELSTYAFDVKPRKKKRGKRYFEGEIWVDDEDFQIVMTRGKIVPDYADNKFPEFETIRQQIDGKYWFPTWTKADDILHFGDFRRGRNDVHIREYITYGNFKKFEVDAAITYEGIKEP